MNEKEKKKADELNQQRIDNPVLNDHGIEDIVEAHNASAEGQITTAQQAVAEEQATKGRLKTSQKTKDIADGKVTPESKAIEVMERQKEEYEKELSEGRGEYNHARKEKPKRRSEKNKKWQEKIANMNNENNNNESNIDSNIDSNINYNNVVAETAKTNGLGKFIDDKGNVDFDKLEKSKTGWKVLQALGNGMAAFGSGMTGHNFTTNGGLASDQLNRRQEVQNINKETQMKKLDDSRDMDTFKNKENLKHEQNKEVINLNHKNDLEKAIAQAELNEEQHKNLMEFQDWLLREGKGADLDWFSKLNRTQQKEFLEMRGMADQQTQTIMQIIGLIRSDESIKKFATRSVFK